MVAFASRPCYVVCVCFVSKLCVKSLNHPGVVFCQKVPFWLLISYDIYVHVCLQDSLKAKLSWWVYSGRSCQSRTQIRPLRANAIWEVTCLLLAASGVFCEAEVQFPFHDWSILHISVFSNPGSSKSLLKFNYAVALYPSLTLNWHIFSLLPPSMLDWCLPTLPLTRQGKK